MDRDVYLNMAAHEHTHWWFVGRRAIIDALLKPLHLSPTARVLEAGCGTGGNLYLLCGYGQVVAFEPDATALALAHAKHPEVRIEVGSLPDSLPMDGEAFDLVAALDVLEHVDDDAGSLAALVGLTRPGGYVLVTVPAHQFLWGSHDRRLHHRRRYSSRDLQRLVASLDVDVERMTFFNTVLAPIALVARLAERMSGMAFGDQERLPPAVLNALLGFAFSAERHLVARTGLPAGLSLALLLRRRSHEE